jgi:saccharopine dehydrogenase-like NADP-dependent oxidoreductase
LKKLASDIEKAGVLFLCEMGLDPGIDHMSAKAVLDAIEESGGTVTSFRSHCGGLVAPESDDNPWHYKVSWNPRNIVLAGKAGAVYKQHGVLKKLDYPNLFAEKRFTEIAGQGPFCWYPNRDSLAYLELYGLHHCDTFVRTTLRHPDFIFGWKNIIDLKLTDETVQYEAAGKSLKALFKEHLEKHNFNDWLERRLREQLDHTKGLLTELMHLTQLEQAAEEKGAAPVDEFMLVEPGGNLKEVAVEDLKINTAAAVAERMHNASLILKQLFFLGLGDADTILEKERCSAADILQFALEKKLALQEADKDMVVMKHELEYSRNGHTYMHTSTLVVKGENNQATAMAKTVGLPLGIAAKLILKGVIRTKGLHIPISKEIYEPVLAELEQHGIRFLEQNEQLA